jgi:phosphoribosylformimino-5-aminoimidazole carboxamide ribotide isomerase
MLIIPAIDLKDGKCVRLKRGVFSDKTVYDEDPLQVALGFKEAGAKRLHLIDLDGAQSGETKNEQIIANVVKELALPVQIGGGIRSMARIEQWLQLGADRVIIGTMAVEQPEVVAEALRVFAPENVVVALDAKDGRVAIKGWQQDSDIQAVDLALELKEVGLERVLFTDISRDGMFTGPNIETTKQIAIKSGLKVIASGGISAQSDLQALTELEIFGVDSAVVGRAFYEGRILPEEVF